MLPYFIFFLFLLSLAHLWEHSDVILRRTVTFFSFTMIAIFIGLKYQVGTDHGNYVRIYNEIANDSQWRKLFPEFGYFLTNKLAISLDFTIQFVYLICGILIALGTLSAASALGVNPVLFFALTFPFHIVMLAVSGIRQGVAESLFIAGFAFFIRNRKALNYYLSMIFSFSFHTSVVFFIFYRFITLRKRWLFLTLACLLPLALAFAEQRYGHYTKLSLDSQGVYLRVGFCLGVSIIFYFCIKLFNIAFDDKFIYRVVYLNIISPIFLFIISPLSTTLVDRVSYYFILTDVLLYLYVFNQYRHHLIVKISTYCIILASFLSLFAFSYFGNNAVNYQYNNLIYEWLKGL